MFKYTLGSSLLAAALLAGVVGLNTAVSADDDHDVAKRLKDAGDIQPLEQIIAKAQAAHPGGRVLETELDRKHDRFVYEVEIADDKGVVWELKYDAKTGELLKSKQEH